MNAKNECNESILIIDDDTVLLDYIEEYLQSIGMRTFTAASCGDAVKILLENPGIELLLCDKNIGIEDGAGFILDAGKLYPGIIFIGMSGSGEAEASFKEKGTHYFLEKPFRLEELKNTINTIVEKRKQKV